jgi:hypothetical protein
MHGGFKLSGHFLSRGLACGRRIRSRRILVVDEGRDFRLHHRVWQHSPEADCYALRLTYIVSWHESGTNHESVLKLLHCPTEILHVCEAMSIGAQTSTLERKRKLSGTR